MDVETAAMFPDGVEEIDAGMIHYQLRINNERQSRILAVIHDRLLTKLLSGKERINLVGTLMEVVA
jgi:hypothetical protein